MNINKPNILLLGNLAIDISTHIDGHISNTRESSPASISFNAGGCVFNHAIALQALSEQSKIISLCGNDQNRNTLTNLLRQTKLDLSGIITHPAKTNITHLIIDNDGDKQILFDRAPVILSPELLQKIACQIPKKGHLHYSLNPWVTTFLESNRILKKKLTMSTDLHDNPEAIFIHSKLLSSLNILFFSGKSKSDPIIFMKKIMTAGPSLVLCCQGANGCLIGETATKTIWSMPAIPQNKIQDTVGAGDVFASTFLSCYLSGNAIREAVLKAQIQAGLSCNHKGILPLHDKKTLEKEYHQMKEEYFSKITQLPQLPVCCRNN